MKSKVNSIVVALLSGFVATPVMATNTTANTTVNATSKTTLNSSLNASLQSSVKQLQEEVALLREQLQLTQKAQEPAFTSDHSRRIFHHYKMLAANNAKNENNPAIVRNRNARRAAVINAIANKRTAAQVAANTATQTANQGATQAELEAPPHSTTRDPVANHEASNAFVLPNTTINPNMNDFYLPFDPYVPGQAFVTTGPYLGVRVQYAGTNLIVNSPSVNNDVQLLDIRKKVIEQLNAIMGEARMKPTFSHLLFSGVIETQAGYIDFGGHPSRTDIDLTNMSIDATIFGPNEWILGLIELSYSPNPPNFSVFKSDSHFRVGNSRVFVNKAFVTIGNFVKSPFYGTFGQFYVPFGTYSSVMVNVPLTRWARTKARSILIGYQQQATNAFYASAYIFRGDSYVHAVPKVDNGGINFGYKFVIGCIKGNIGGGLISNLADSGGMQVGNNFQVFEHLVHRVPAYNLRGVFSIGDHIDIISEFVGASNPFNPLDMSYNYHGAQPTAWDLEINYSFPILDNKPSSIGIGYSKSNEALAMGIPLTRSFIVFNTSLRRNTLQSLELKHDRQYAASDVATQAGFVIVAPQNGRSDNSITAQFDYYF